jgi:hypothetical protein
MKPKRVKRAWPFTKSVSDGSEAPTRDGLVNGLINRSSPTLRGDSGIPMSCKKEAGSRNFFAHPSREARDTAD